MHHNGVYGTGGEGMSPSLDSNFFARTNSRVGVGVNIGIVRRYQLAICLFNGYMKNGGDT